MKNMIIDKMIVGCVVIGMVIIGVFLFQYFKQPATIEERVSLVQNNAEAHYDVQDTSAEWDDYTLSFEICDHEDKLAFKKHIRRLLKKYHIENLFLLDVSQN